MDESVLQDKPLIDPERLALRRHHIQQCTDAVAAVADLRNRADALEAVAKEHQRAAQMIDRGYPLDLIREVGRHR